MANRGYSKATIARINAADQTLLGVQLGQLCVLHGYSIIEVTGVFNISRMTAYNWFTGKTNVSRHLSEKVQFLVDRLKSKPVPEPVVENE